MSYKATEQIGKELKTEYEQVDPKLKNMLNEYAEGLCQNFPNSFYEAPESCISEVDKEFLKITWKIVIHLKDFRGTQLFPSVTLKVPISVSNSDYIFSVDGTDIGSTIESVSERLNILRERIIRWYQ